MENKTTVELLTILENVPEEGSVKYDEFWASGGVYEQAIAALKNREPFTTLLGEMDELSLPSAWEAIEKLQEQVKQLKRHKQVLLQLLFFEVSQTQFWYQHEDTVCHLQSVGQCPHVEVKAVVCVNRYHCAF